MLTSQQKNSREGND